MGEYGWVRLMLLASHVRGGDTDMPDTPEVGDACNLDEDGVGWVRVSYFNNLVSIVGYGEKVDLRCREALKLFGWLGHHHAFLLDRANNYYDCQECGYVHHKSVLICPTLMQPEE